MAMAGDGSRECPRAEPAGSLSLPTVMRQNGTSQLPVGLHV